jgi:cellulose synthase/poly-beta-1,6-N-acetylglucosamine synthase-like glycosyltransferase
MFSLTSLSFWFAVACIIYVYVGYPALVLWVGSIRRRQVCKQSITPRVSLVIAAYNEERNIAERLDNALSLDYPSEALEIIVASDGSEDATAAIVRSYAARGVRLLALPRQGKIHALNAAVAQAAGDILVFSDANTLFDRQALKKLVQNFADPEVGGVAGSKIYLAAAESEASTKGEQLYWSYDIWIKQLETLTGSIVSADGAIYAIRRDLYPVLGDSAVTDDFAISTAVVERQCRLVFEPEAHAYEIAIPTARREFARKVRLMTRGLRGIILRKRLLNPYHYGFYSLILFSHKVLRRLVPVFLVLLFLTSILAISHGAIYTTAAVAQGVFYGLAAAGYGLRRTRLGRQKCFVVPFFYCLANAAALMALIKVCSGEKITLWQPQRHGTSS